MSARRPPLLARWLLRACPLGARRAEIAGDLEGLFEKRQVVHGGPYARRRFWRDVASVWRSRVFGSVSGTAGDVTESAGAFESMRHDVWYSVRTLRRQPSFVVIASLTLAVGLAANVAVFAAVDRLLLAAPPGVVDADHVRRMHIDVPGTAGGRFTWYQMPFRIYAGLRLAMGPFDEMAAYRRASGSIGVGPGARPVAAVFADGHYFKLLGARPIAGRFFDTADDLPPAGGPVIVLSESCWRSQFGADVSLIGRDVQFGAARYTVIGIAPAGFSGDTFDPVDVWLPLQAASPSLSAEWRTSATNRSLSVLVRFSGDRDPAGLATEAAALARTAGEGTLAANPDSRVLLASLSAGRTMDGAFTRESRIALWLEGVSLLVLIVAIANVMNLQIGRAAERQNEVAVRIALGVSRARLVRQSVIESSLLAAASAIVAWLVADAGTAGLQKLLNPEAGTLVLSGRHLALTAACAAVAALACGMSSAFHLWRPPSAIRLRSARGGDGGSRSRLRRTLLVVQVAVSLVLLIGAGLFTKSMIQMRGIDFGIDPARVLVIQSPLSQAGFTAERIELFYARALEQLAGLSVVEHVSAGQSVPFSPSASAPVSVPGFERPPFDPQTSPTYYAVTPGYFSTVGMSILRGRAFSESDVLGAPPVILVEKALAEHIWPGQDPLGKCLKIGSAADAPCREIVGVTSNTRRFVVNAGGSMRFYLPLRQRLVNATAQALLVRVKGDAAAAIPAVRAAVLQIAPDIPYTRIRVLSELAEPESRPWRLGSTLLSIFGAVSLFVAAFGVYGLLTALMTQRKREMGVRLALGATPAGLTRLVLAQSCRWISLGLIVGLSAAAAAARFVEPLLFETRALDLQVFVIAPLVLAGMAFIASVVPALRVSNLDPNRTLRGDAG